MRGKIKNFIYNLNLRPFLRNIILFESNPDFSDNTKAVFDELLNRGINEKYKMIWFVDDKDKFKDIKIRNVYFVNGKRKNNRKLHLIILNLFSKYIIDCNVFIQKLNKCQFRIHLTHGEAIKVAREYFKYCGKFDYILQTSDIFVDMISKMLNIPEKKVLVDGYPRNDIFFNDEISSFFGNKYNKIILWMPTFRNYEKCDPQIKKDFIYGVPSIKSGKELKELNDYLKKNKSLLAIKLHPAEDISNMKKMNLSNIKLINNEELTIKHLTIRNILKETDALITDYSSVYYDYLLLDKPIGMAIEDIEDYKKYTELLYDDLEKNLPAQYIYNYKDLMKFIEDIVNNKDKYKKKRMEATKKYHKYIDGNSSKRVVDVIVNHMEGNNK